MSSMRQAKSVRLRVRSRNSKRERKGTGVVNLTGHFVLAAKSRAPRCGSTHRQFADVVGQILALMPNEGVVAAFLLTVLVWSEAIASSARKYIAPAFSRLSNEHDCNVHILRDQGKNLEIQEHRHKYTS